MSIRCGGTDKQVTKQLGIGLFVTQHLELLLVMLVSAQQCGIQGHSIGATSATFWAT